MKNESGQVPAANWMWLIVGVLVIIALIIWIAPHFHG